MPWKHVYAPIKGLITSAPATGIPSEASPSLRGVFLRDGEVHSDYGITNYPEPGLLKTNYLLGTLMSLDQFFLLNGTSYLMAFTTQHVYYFNEISGTWDVVTMGILIDACESAWTASANVTSTVDSSVKLRGVYSAKHVIAGAFTGTSGGGLDLYTKLLVHWDGVDGATTYTTEDTGARTVTFVGTAQLDTAQKVFGTASLLLDGNSDYVTIPDSADWAFGADDFTIDFRVRFASITGYQGIIGQYESGTRYWYIRKMNTHDIQLVFQYDAVSIYYATTTGWPGIAVDTWYHVAVERTGTTAKIFINGVSQTLSESGAFGTNNVGNIAGALNLGCPDGTWYLNGWMEEFRISNTARWAANFTPATEAYSAPTVSPISYFNISSLDLSAASNTHLSFWIYSTVALVGDTLHLRLSEQNAGGTGATYAEYSIPTVVANTWTHCSIALNSPALASAGTFPTDLNAVLSVALVANLDPGAVTVYLDDIRTTRNFTGTEDNRFSVTTQNDTLIVTNGIDAPSKITSGPAHAALTLTLPSGAITTSEVVLAFKDHVLYMNNTENGADTPQRVSWTNIGTIDDHLLGTAGFQDLIDNSDWIVGAAVLSDNEIAIYKEWSVVQCTWVGGHTPFRFRTLLPVTGVVGKDAVADGDSKNIAMSRTNLYYYNGTDEIEAIDESIKKTFFNDLDETYSNRTFIIDNREDDEYQVWIPTTASTPTVGWCYSIIDKSWYKRSKAISGFGFYKQQSSLTIGDLVGTIGEQNWTFGSQLVKANSPIIIVGDTGGKVYRMDKLTLNNAGVAIENEFQTPDFVLPETPEYMDKYMRVSQMAIEAYGQSIEIHWSEDEGSSWNVTQGNGENTISLATTVSDYQQYFEASVKKIRFRLRNLDISSGFNLRYFGFFYEVRTGRR